MPGSCLSKSPCAEAQQAAAIRKHPADDGAEFFVFPAQAFDFGLGTPSGWDPRPPAESPTIQPPTDHTAAAVLRRLPSAARVPCLAVGLGERLDRPITAPHQPKTLETWMQVFLKGIEQEMLAYFENILVDGRSSSKSASAVVLEVSSMTKSGAPGLPPRRGNCGVPAPLGMPRQVTGIASGDR